MSPGVWYFARSAGIVAYLLLSSSVLLGVLMAGKSTFTWPKFAVEEVHRFLAILTGVFIVLHGGSLLLDRVVPISLGQELVPFTSPYRPADQQSLARRDRRGALLHDRRRRSEGCPAPRSGGAGVARRALPRGPLRRPRRAPRRQLRLAEPRTSSARGVTSRDDP
ncbi:MAG TPA: hypothetical protein VLJ44_13985, partial [Gaiellaceae bacterium]|nr:hypothetical protein [Gaiellaceae bacterium]